MQEDNRHYKWGQEFYELLKNSTSSQLNVKLRYFEDEKHQMDVDIKSDEVFVNALGYIALHDRNIPDVAVAIFEINSKNYPSSVNVWDSLAEAYLVKGLKGKAKACYEKILSLQPDNIDAKRNLKKLNN
jgi:tetratricopeptide (TPR) repeat protein